MGISIEVTDLRKQYGSVRALDGLSLSVDSSVQCLGIIGRNGAGKTTFLRILVDLLEADSGSICVRYEDETYPFVDPVHGTYIAESITLLPTLKGKEMLDLYSEINRSLGIRTDLTLRDELVSELNLDEHLAKYCGRMSKGTQRKVEIVAALSARTPLFIADELAEGLDAPSRLFLEQVIARLAENQQFIISSHDIGFVSSVADHVAVIDHGRIVDSFGTQDTGPKEFHDRVVNSFQVTSLDTQLSDPPAD